MVNCKPDAAGCPYKGILLHRWTICILLSIGVKLVNGGTPCTHGAVLPPVNYTACCWGYLLSSSQCAVLSVVTIFTCRESLHEMGNILTYILQKQKLWFRKVRWLAQVSVNSDSHSSWRVLDPLYKHGLYLKSQVLRKIKVASHSSRIKHQISLVALFLQVSYLLW